MQRIQLNDGHFVSVYNDIAQLSAGRYNEFQAWSIQAAGIGGDMEAVGQHFERLTGFIAQERQQEAIDELANLHFNFHYIIQRVAPAQLAFGCLVGEVDGVGANDLTEEGLTALIARLSEYGLTQGQIEECIEATKKKSAPLLPNTSTGSM